jgi:hypothetical protein
MDLVRTRKGWQEIPPKRCANGHELRGGTCIVGTQHCKCGRTHRTHTCRTCGDTVMTPPTGSACVLKYLDER